MRNRKLKTQQKKALQKWGAFFVQMLCAYRNCILQIIKLIKTTIVRQLLCILIWLILNFKLLKVWYCFAQSLKSKVLIVNVDWVISFLVIRGGELVNADDITNKVHVFDRKWQLRADNYITYLVNKTGNWANYVSHEVMFICLCSCYVFQI